MVNFIKISSLIIILLFFPISFYFIPINCNSEDDFKVKMEIAIESDKDHLYIIIFNFFLEKDNKTIIMEDIDWGNVSRNGSILYVNIQIKKYREAEENEIAPFVAYQYELVNLEEGKYTFNVYVNGKLCETREFGIIKEVPMLQCSVSLQLIWNEEEWILRVKLISNMVPKGIHWDPLIRKEDKFIINVKVDEWIGNISEHFYKYGEYNYSLGILEEGSYSIYTYINGEFDSLSIISISWTFTTYVPTTYTTTETYTEPIIIYSNGKYYQKIITTTKTRIETQKLITSTIKVKEKITTTAITTETLTTKTIRTFTKEKFEIENFIPIFSFIIVIMITILLYYILFKRREI
jgi:hypothetical protein